MSDPPARMRPDEAYGDDDPRYRLDRRIVLNLAAGQPLFDREIIPLLNAITGMGIVTTGSCAGHSGPDDSGAWSRFDVEGTAAPARVSALLRLACALGRRRRVEVAYEVFAGAAPGELSFKLRFQPLLSAWNPRPQLILTLADLISGPTAQAAIARGADFPAADLLEAASAVVRARPSAEMPPVRPALDGCGSGPIDRDTLRFDSHGGRWTLIVQRPVPPNTLAPVRPGTYLGGRWHARAGDTFSGGCWVYAASSLAALRRALGADWPALAV